MKAMNMEAPSSGENIKTLFGSALNTIKTGVSGWLNKIMHEPSSAPLIEGVIETKQEGENTQQITLSEINKNILRSKSEYDNCKVSCQIFEGQTYAYVLENDSQEVKGVYFIKSKCMQGVSEITDSPAHIQELIGTFVYKNHIYLESDYIDWIADFMFEGNEIYLSKEGEHINITVIMANNTIMPDEYIEENKFKILGHYYQNRKVISHESKEKEGFFQTKQESEITRELTVNEFSEQAQEMSFERIERIILESQQKYSSCKVYFDEFNHHTYAYIIDPVTGEVKGLCEITSRYTDADGIEPVTCPDTLNTYIGKFFDRYHHKLEPEDITGSVYFTFEGNNISLSKENKQYHISGTTDAHRILTDAYISENRNEILGYYYQNRKFLQLHTINPKQSGEVKNEEVLTTAEKEQKTQEDTILSDLMYKIGQLGLSIKGFNKKLSFEQSKKQMNTIIRALEMKAEYQLNLEKLQNRLEYVKAKKDQFFQWFKGNMFPQGGQERPLEYQTNRTKALSSLQQVTQQEESGIKTKESIVESIKRVNGVIKHISKDVGLQYASNDEDIISDNNSQFVA